MAYKKSVYIKAKQALDERRAQAEAKAQLRHDEVVEKCPQIAEIEREMASFGAEAIRYAARGEDAKEYIMQLSVKDLEAQRKRKELLNEAGYREDYLENVYFCPVCKDTGTHGNFYCKCYMELIKQTARDGIKASAQMKKCTFETFDLKYYSDETDPAIKMSHRELMKNIVAYLKDYSNEFSRSSKGLIMLGKTGLGKTHLSLSIVNRLVDRGFNVYYDSAQSILDRLQKQHFSRDSADEDIDDDIYESDLLVIDDLGTEFSTSFTVSALYNVLNTRINNGLPTIISTNMKLNEIEEKYSQRFASRIVGDCDVVEFFGKDIRQQKARLGL